MPGQLLALGKAGARMAKACLMLAIMGEMPSAHILLMAAPQESGLEMRQLVDAYQKVHVHSGTQSGPSSADISLTCWPQETLQTSIGEQALLR